MEKPVSSIIVIFGASGDLTKKKLLPALMQIYKDKLMCDTFAVLGVSRTEYSNDEFRMKMLEDIKNYSDDKDINQDLLESFSRNLFYLSINTSDADEYIKLKLKLQELDSVLHTNGNFIYYLATPPSLYLTIAGAIAKHGLQNNSHVSKKIIIEKPFGYDLESAVDLNEKLHGIFKENQIYRIDHYLGKETVQNILILRFANGIFEPMWNRNFIDHVEITSAEFIGVEDRGGYYEGSGALRDMIQNHMLQLLGFVAMEPPSSFEANAVRNETIKVFESFVPINEDEVDNYVVRGQYTASTVRGEKIKGYREERNVSPDSRTETYAAVKLFIDNWRWNGVPFYIRAGKRLPTRVTEAVIHFKETPHQLFRKYNVNQNSNQLIIRIQPDEGILLKFGMKVPGAGYKVQTVNMDFHYTDILNTHLPSAYERLLLDCMLGDSTLYARADAVEECWRFVDPILKAWENNPAIKVYGYPAGTWGPVESFDLFKSKEAVTPSGKTEWRYPCKNLTDDGLYCEL